MLDRFLRRGSTDAWLCVFVLSPLEEIMAVRRINEIVR
jgi:hypothetical protein